MATIARIMGKISRRKNPCKCTYKCIRILLVSVAHIVGKISRPKILCESTSTGHMNSPDIAHGWLHPRVYLSTLLAMSAGARSNPYRYFWWALLKLWEKAQGQKFSVSPQVQVAWTVRTSPSAVCTPAFTYQLCWQCQSGSTGCNQWVNTTC